MSVPPTTRDELLKPVRGRWNWLRKFWICHGIDHKVITREEVRVFHGISDEELLSWCRTYNEEGAHGFRRQAPNPRRYAA
jgi:hypothetical protein